MEFELEITKGYLESKIAEYKQSSEQSLKNSIAQEGAAQALEMLLAELNKPTAEPTIETK